MTFVVFAGPSLAGVTQQTLSGLTVLPPARQGDVYRALRLNPRAIGIVDGYFEGVPSVWHKEILWAMSCGVAVYGSASMGALRAAEMHPYGMIGVGDVFAAYRDGEIEADDEVALLHGPPESGFLPLTEALVNVRATCRAAETAGILSGAEAEAVVATARSIFYKARTWREIVARATKAGAASKEHLANFESWLRGNAVDQKRLDALSLIERLRVDAGAPSGERPAIHFEPTFLWETAVEGWARAPADGDIAQRGLEASVLDQLRLEPQRYRDLKSRARLRLAALRDADAGATEAAPPDDIGTGKRHRRAHGLFRAADLERWLSEQQLDRGEYDRLIAETALAEAVGEAEDPDLREQMIALLKLDGQFGAAAERAAAKAAVLAEGVTMPGHPPPMLVEWLFRVRLGKAVPDDIDLLVRDLGFESREAFYKLIAEEHAYWATSEKGRS